MAGNVVLHFRLQVHHPDLLEADVLDEIRNTIALLEWSKTGQRPLIPLEGYINFGFDDR